MRVSQRGVTLIELIMIMGLVIALGALALFVSLDSFRGYLYHTDRDLLITALQHARAEAIGSVCLDGGTTSCVGAVAHGVHIDTEGGFIQDYVVFQGMNYQADDPANALIGASGALTLATSDSSDVSEIVFKPSSGQVGVLGASGSTMVLVDTVGRVSTTTIGDEGQISWTH